MSILEFICTFLLGVFAYIYASALCKMQGKENDDENYQENEED